MNLRSNQMMKRMVLGMWALLGLGVLALVVGALMQPEDYVVERSVVVHASAEVAFAEVVNLKRWEQWSPWAGLDPKMSKRYLGDKGRVGASYTWEGDKKVGAGTIRTTKVDRPRLIKFAMSVYEPLESHSDIVFHFQEKGNGTKVTWQTYGRNENLLSKIFYMLMNFEKMIGAACEEGLENYKEVVEQKAK